MRAFSIAGCGRWVLCASFLLGVQARGLGQSQGRGQPADSKDAERAKLISDTHKLLTLSREVQAEMAKNGPDTLSLGMVKKVEELQRLAAAVKAEMAKTP